MTIERLARFLLDIIFPSDERQEIHIKEVSLHDLWLEARPSDIPHIQDAYALFSYQHKTVKALITSLKFHRRKESAKVLGEALSEWLIEEIHELALFRQEEKPLLIPIPLSRKRRIKRGFNQVEEIITAAHIDSLCIPRFDLLKKKKHVQSQTLQSDKFARKKNLQGAFYVASPQCVHGATVILLDDVITTGSTIKEARRVLLESGAARVTCVAIAH